MPKSRTRANGAGTVFRRGKTWTAETVVGYKPDKEGIMRPVRVTKGGFRTRTAALEAIPDLKSRGRTSAEKRIVTIESLWQSYSATAMQKISKDKQSHYRTARKKLESIAYIDIRLLTIDDLQTTTDDVAPTYYPAKDIKTLLSHLYDRARAEQIVQTNLSDYITLPDLHEKPTTPFSNEEIVTLWHGWQDGDDVCGYALLMLYTGMMPGELCRLYADMIDFDAQIIKGCGIKTDIRKERPIILPDVIVPVVRELCATAEQNKGKLLPCRYDAFCTQFREMIARLGLRPELKPYSCRHTTATNLALADMPVLAIKDVMRHSKITTTQRYVHLDSAPLVAATNDAYSRDSTPNILPTSAEKMA